MTEAQRAYLAVLEANHVYNIVYDPCATAAHAAYLASDESARAAFDIWASACEATSDAHKAYIATEVVAENALSAWLSFAEGLSAAETSTT